MLTNRDCCIERVLFFHFFLQQYSTLFQALTMDSFNHPKPRLLSMQQSLLVNLAKLNLFGCHLHQLAFLSSHVIELYQKNTFPYHQLLPIYLGSRYSPVILNSRLVVGHSNSVDNSLVHLPLTKDLVVFRLAMYLHYCLP